MTMERRLPTAAAFIERETGLRIMRPTKYWGLARSQGLKLTEVVDSLGLPTEEIIDD